MPCGIFIPRKWRLHRAVWALIVLEFPFTVANLALFGIASPNLYRTILWEEGGRMGFNSDPTTVLYAYANYRPVKIPVVWSNFNTQYNLVIGVLCTFFYLIKVTLWLMHVFYPILSLPLHLAMLALWAVSVYVQTAPDTIDPERTNNGAPWYITKNCNIVSGRAQHYCMQAKSAFAVSVVMLIIYALFTLATLYSLYPSPAERERHRARLAEKKAEKEKWAALSANTSPYDNEMTAEEQWQHMWELQQLPRTPGTAGGLKSPLTPRTRAFRDLGGQGNLHSALGNGAGVAGTGMTPGTASHLMQYEYPPPPPPQAAYTAPGGGQVFTNADYYGPEEQPEFVPPPQQQGQQQQLGKQDPGDVEWKGKATAY